MTASEMTFGGIMGSSMKEWTYAGRYNTNTIPTPAGAKEIFLCGYYGSVSLYLPIKDLNCRSGFYRENGNSGDFYASFNDTNITISAYVVGGGSQLSHGIDVYYR